MKQEHAALAYIENESGVLSVWNRKYKVWGLPGGKVEVSDLSIEHACMRELYEETGLTTERDSLKHIYCMPTYSGSGRMCYVLSVARVSGLVGTTETDADVGWMSREFLCSQERLGLGEWFRAFFAHLDACKA